jgi:hypothetical protein
MVEGREERGEEEGGGGADARRSGMAHVRGFAGAARLPVGGPACAHPPPTAPTPPLSPTPPVPATQHRPRPSARPPGHGSSTHHEAGGPTQRPTRAPPPAPHPPPHPCRRSSSRPGPYVQSPLLHPRPPSARPPRPTSALRLPTPACPAPQGSPTHHAADGLGCSPCAQPCSRPPTRPRSFFRPLRASFRPFKASFRPLRPFRALPPTTWPVGRCSTALKRPFSATPVTGQQNSVSFDGCAGTGGGWGGGGGRI